MTSSVKDSKFIQQLRATATENISAFFEGKEWFCGGPIPKKQLFSRKSLDIVIGTEFCLGIDLIYETLAGFTKLQENNRDIRFVIKLLTETKKNSVPKDFQAGIILLFLHFCKGAALPEKDFDITHLMKCEEET